ncbi:unnamed protein product [Rotaria sordida]|uniref:WASH complex subunit strumpellin n=4 Tax=Rotaria sordida TaxID=392033 RepID=A0A814FD15_9BILA|nr:unnamed protein product [Rotaria sordida]CAF1182733.1 unnamed protein product [Rotaria sordida]
MSDFLATNNPCGQNLLQLVATGNAIIAELLRLADFIPPLFKVLNIRDAGKYADIIFDFSYFSKQEYYDDLINNRADLQDLDDEFRENNLTLLTRFYQAFESVQKYGIEFNRYIEDLTNGTYLQQTVESVIANEAGKQLMTEAVYLFGVMLIILDLKYDGAARERMIVSYFRYSGKRNALDSNIDEVGKLLARNDGFSLQPYKRPVGYPENYFRRIGFREDVIGIIIGRLRSDDIYNQKKAYTELEHQTAAYATQASMLYVLLYFYPDVLHNKQAVMREIVDKHFADNWVINLYMGMTVNLIDAWEPYKAAKAALNNTLDIQAVKSRCQMIHDHISKLNKQVEQYLIEGVLIEEYVLKHISTLLKFMKECNICLKWIILHASELPIGADINKRCKQMLQIVTNESQYDPSQVFKLLLNTAQFEFNLKEIVSLLLVEKHDRWIANRKEAVERLIELADVFSGTMPLTRVEKNDNLQSWFRTMAKRIESLDFEDWTSAGRQTNQIMTALDEVQQFHELDTNMQVKQFLNDNKRLLSTMILLNNVQESTISIMDLVADLSYAWIIIDSFTGVMQEGIKRSPSLVTKLRATFLKLSSALDLPLVRINQVGSNDLMIVSHYYSGELVAYVRKVLQIIPETMFSMLANIVYLQTHTLRELPLRAEKDKLREYAQLDERYQVAKLTHDISIFTESMLMMKTTLVGIIKLDPKRVLEDGIRKELVKQVATALHNGLTFNPRAKNSELISKLDALGNQMDGFRRSFEYVQDYVGMYGLKIWQEEVSRIINYNVEQESNSFLKQKIYDFQSTFQSRHIPIPYIPPLGDGSINFMGRLVREILRVTDPRLTFYAEQRNTWYDVRTKQPVVDILLFRKLHRAVGSFGLSGLDRLLSFMIVKELQLLTGTIQGVFLHKESSDMLDSFMRQLIPIDSIIAQPNRVYSNSVAKGANAWSTLSNHLMKIGQMQLLRQQIAHELTASAKYDSKYLFYALKTFNDTLLQDIQQVYTNSNNQQNEHPETMNELLYELGPLLESVGMNDVLQRVYISAQNHFLLIPLLVLYTISQVPRIITLKYLKNQMQTTSSSSSSSGKRDMDCSAFVIGLYTLTKQYHSDLIDDYLTCLCQFIKSHIEQAGTQKLVDFPIEAINMLDFLTMFMHYGDLPIKVLEQRLPAYICDEFRTI